MNAIKTFDSGSAAASTVARTCTSVVEPGAATIGGMAGYAIWHQCMTRADRRCAGLVFLDRPLAHVEVA